MKIVPMNFYQLEVTGAREEDASKVLEKRLDFIDHARGYGHLSSVEYDVEIEEAKKSVERDYCVTIKVVY